MASRKPPQANPRPPPWFLENKLPSPHPLFVGRFAFGFWNELPPPTPAISPAHLVLVAAVVLQPYRARPARQVQQHADLREGVGQLVSLRHVVDLRVRDPKSSVLRF